MDESTSKLGTERAAFLVIRPELVEKHSGKVILFRSGKVQGVFDSYDDAYAAGLEKFGPDEAFLIDDLSAPNPPSVSLSWLHGLTHVHS